MSDSDYPILVFPKAARADRENRPRGAGKLGCPEARRQGERLFPQFQRLQDALENRRIAIKDSSLGIEPEMVLVLETVGTVQNFFRAVKEVKGLEWLVEYQVEEIAPGDGFEDARHPEKSLDGRLFLIMSDNRALTQLQNLFRRWSHNPEESLNTGLAPFKYVFKHLRQIRPWDVNDRLNDTGVLDDWRDRETFGQTTVSFEAELWYRENSNRRQAATDRVQRLVKELDGKIVTECIIQDIAYHAILGQVKISHIHESLNRPEARQDLALLQCDDIMFFRPVGQCAVPIEDETEEVTSEQVPCLEHRTVGDPVAALLDGMPLSRHSLLDGCLIVDDPDGYEDLYQARERSHGTAMASLICHGDLNSPVKEPLRKPIYVRPIMQPQRGFGDQFNEVIPDDVLPVDLVHRAIVRMFDGESDEPPVSPRIRVVNLSIGDPARPFVREMSGWARLLDWLSYRYNILFMVSAGNHTHHISLRTNVQRLQNLNGQECQRLVISAIVEDTRNRRLLSPAETLNGLTVGASHMDDSDPVPNYLVDLVDPLRSEMPSFISAHGPGYRRAIKPDIHLPGGKQLLSEDLTSQEGTILGSP